MHSMDYEERGLPLIPLFSWILGLLACLGGVLVFVYVVYGTPTMKPEPELVLKRPMNQPVLQSNGYADMKAFRLEQEAILNSYGWVNQAQGIVRLPIAKAMELVISRGLPARKNAP